MRNAKVHCKDKGLTSAATSTVYTAHGPPQGPCRRLAGTHNMHMCMLQLTRASAVP